MNIDNESVDSYLKGMIAPEYESAEHRRRLRGEVLARLQHRPATGLLGGRWKTVVLVLGLLCAAAAATELALEVHRYYFEGRASDGSYHFSAEPEVTYQRTRVDPNGVARTVSVQRSQGSVVSSGGKELDAAAIEQKRQDLEEIAQLRQRNARQLLWVMDTEVNGKFLARTFGFQYVLADGRVETIGEGDPANAVNLSPAQIEQDQAQMDALRAQGRAEVTKVIDTDLAGQVQRTLICRYILADGREVTRGEGDPAMAFPAKTLTPEQLRELWRLISLGQGEFQGSVEAQMYGQTFTFKQYRFQLADGTVVTHSEGEPQGPKTNLTKDDWAELRQLAAAQAGESLGEYTDVIDSRRFKFARTRYVLSDGTQVFWSRGLPAENR